jgi:hypothetical protein
VLAPAIGCSGLTSCRLWTLLRSLRPVESSCEEGDSGFVACGAGVGDDAAGAGATSTTASAG